MGLCQSCKSEEFATEQCDGCTLRICLLCLEVFDHYKDGLHGNGDPTQALLDIRLELAQAKCFIRRFSRWVETPSKPDLFFGKLNLLYVDAAPFDDERPLAEDPK